MALRLHDHWLWDFWLAVDGDDVHVFFLKAPRSLGDPERRHRNVSIGHALSRDLVSWQVVADAVVPGPDGGWDDATTWTGSVVWDGDRWVMFYTGTSTVDDGLVQRIGSVVSDDLMTWTRPRAHHVVEAAAPTYERLDSAMWYEEAWRDPWVHRCGEGWRMLVTARAQHGPSAVRGVIGTAHSRDLVHWDLGMPLTTPARYGHMEIPQLVEVGGRWVLSFSVPRRRLGSGHRVDEAGTHYMVADDPGGPFTWDVHKVLLGEHDDPDGASYGAKLLWHAGRWRCLAWLAEDGDGTFLGVLGDPWDVDFDGTTISLSRADVTA